MYTKNASKFQIIPTKKKSQSFNFEQIPFFPKYDTKYLHNDYLRVTWFGTAFSQSMYSYENFKNGSNACTLIVILTAAHCHFNKIEIEGPEKPINSKLICALAYGMLIGNHIHETLKSSGKLHNINLTVPEAIKHAGDFVQGIHEWKVVLHPQLLHLSLYENLKRHWRKWHHYCKMKKRRLDLYIVLVSDSRSVLFIFQDEFDTVSLIDSHRHSQNKGAFIATISRKRLKILCRWFTDLIYRCYNSCPRVYELAFLYFKS